MQSCIYEGRIDHRRFSPVKRRFQYRLFMVYLDLAELPELLSGLWPLSARRFGWTSFVRSDHLGDANDSLLEATRNLVQDQTGLRPAGPIRLLTQLRHLGYYLSPLNLYYCFDPDGVTVETVVAEVSNTPWGERHCYVLWEGNRTSPGLQLGFTHPKSFHVSPFMPMELEYRWLLSQPADRLGVNVENLSGGEPFFAARLSMVRLPLTGWRLTRSTIRRPIMTAQIFAAIYYQALRLWMKKCPFYPHPKSIEATAARSR